MHMNRSDFASFTNQSVSFLGPSYNSSPPTGTSELHDRVTLALRFPIDLIGILTNGLLLNACYRQLKTENSAVGFLIIELVGCWFFNCAVTYPWGDVGRIIIVSGKPLGLWYCIARIEFTMTSAVFSNCIDACLAVNRFVAICLPMHYKRINTLRGVVVMNVCTVVFSATVLLPIMGVGGRYISTGLTECAFITETSVEKAMSSVTQFLPVAVIGTFCSLTILRVIFLAFEDRRRGRVSVDRSKQPDAPARQRKTMQRRVQLSGMLFVSYMFSLACGLPYGVLNAHFRWIYVQYPNLSVWIGLIYRFPFPICPVIMILMSRDYTKSVKTLLRVCFRIPSRKVDRSGQAEPVQATSGTAAGSDMKV